jgi:hypothetical protein
LQWVLQLLFISAVSLDVWERYYLVLLAPGLLLLTAVLTAPTAEPESTENTPQQTSEPGPPRGAGLPLAPRGSIASRPVFGRLPRPGPWPATAFALLTGGVLAFSLASMHDGFATRHAVAEAVRDLRARRIPTDRIDAGFAWNGWFHAGPLRRERLLPTSEREIWYLARVFPDLKDDYVISLTPVPDRATLGCYPYRAWLPPPGSRREVWILGPRMTRDDHG